MYTTHMPTNSLAKLSLKQRDWAERQVHQRSVITLGYRSNHLAGGAAPPAAVQNIFIQQLEKLYANVGKFRTTYLLYKRQ